MQAEIDRLAGPIRELKARPIVDRDGRPAVSAEPLPGDKVREGEALLGNLIADAIRARADADLALVEGGGVRSGVEANSPITYGTVYRVFPFNNTLCRVTLKGSDVLAALEHGVSRYRGSGNGRFLQVSGLRYAFDPSNPAPGAGQPGRRVTRVEVAVRGQPGRFERLDPDAGYTVACDSYLRGGGDDFAVLRDRAVNPNDDLGAVQDVLIEFIAANSPLRPRLEGRIQVVK
jgi:5'-nucleotidase